MKYQIKEYKQIVNDNLFTNQVPFIGEKLLSQARIENPR
jgi:hypothetical protein